jgi:hypothetical protein
VYTPISSYTYRFNIAVCHPKNRARNQRIIIKSVRDGTFEYKSKEPVTPDWAQYGRAQIYEMIYYLDNIRDLVDEADERIKKRTPPKKQGPGRPPTDPADVAKALLLQTYVNSSNRVAEGFLLLFREKLGIDCHFSYKAFMTLRFTHEHENMLRLSRAPINRPSHPILISSNRFG